MRNRNLIRIAALSLLMFAAVVGVVSVTATSAEADPTSACFLRCKAKGGSTAPCAADCFDN